MKVLIKCIIFIIIVGVIIFNLNGIYTINIFSYVGEWSDSSTIANFYNEAKDSIDVLVLGTSTTSNGVQPAVLWNEQQITAYNLSTEQQYSLAAYYLLMEALKYQHPNVVVINARWVTAQYDTEEAAVDSGSGALHLSLDFMRLSGVKIRAALDIASKSDTQSSMDYILPLYKYHSREDLTKNDFNFSYIYEQHALKGSCIQLEAHEIELYPFTIEKVPPAAYDYSGISAVYAEKMIELCEANGINVLLLSLPVTGWDQTQHAAVQNFADTHSVSYLDMNMSDLIEKNQIDPKTDFADGNHENIFGSYKTS
ncbi:MAG: hypothetical protein AAGU32_19405, partial [Bacillota bacterium]